MKTWTSKLGPHLQRFEEMKKALGYSYRHQSVALHSFDQFCFTNFPEATTLTQEMALAWFKRRREEERASTTNARISLFRELARFIKLTDPECFVPDKRYRLRVQPVVCRILTDLERKQFFSALEKMQNPTKYPYLVQTCRTYFIFLYCTGVRASEAVHLDRNHIDFKSGEINIIESKRHYSRKIVLSYDLLKIFKKYDSLLPNDRIPFFSFDSANRPSIELFYYYLKKIWSLSNLTSKCIRQHDFRHTFITKRILEWQQNHENLKEKIQILMRFVGHKHIDDTLYYFRMTPELSNYFSCDDNDDVIPDLGDRNERVY